MEEKSFDVVVIGGGPAGYKAAIRLSELKAEVALIEKDALGGVCTNRGCIPSKSMVYALELLEKIKKADRFGIKVSDVSFDFSSIKNRVCSVVNIAQLGIKKLLQANNVTLIRGVGKIVNKNMVRVKSDNPMKIKTKSIVIATGSEPKKIPSVDTDSVQILTSDDVFRLDALPKSIVIIGGGYIGVEFATIFSRLGVSVAIVEAMPRILLSEDEEISHEVEKILLRSNVKIMKGTSLKEVSKEKEDLVLKLKSSNEIDFDITCEKVIVAVGRKPVLNAEELSGVGIEFDDNGIKVNDLLQTSLKNIYAIGDVNGLSMLAHSAYMQAEVAAENIMGKTRKYDNSFVPRVIFTIPEIASVGDVTKLPKGVRTFKFPYAANPKARIMLSTDGFIKVYSKDDKLLGVSIMSPEASNMISEAVLALNNNISLKRLLESIRPHPTLSEAFSDALSGLVKCN